MSERNTLKARLAAEMAHVVFAGDDVPSAAWDRLDKKVDDVFADCTTGRLRTLVDDLDELRGCESDPLELLSGTTSPTGPTMPDLGDDWDTLTAAIKESIDELNPASKEEVEEASGASTLELVTHGG